MKCFVGTQVYKYATDDCHVNATMETRSQCGSIVIELTVYYMWDSSFFLITSLWLTIRIFDYPNRPRSPLIRIIGVLLYEWSTRILDFKSNFLYCDFIFWLTYGLQTTPTVVKPVCYVNENIKNVCKNRFWLGPNS
jgi:hypothetical protein